MPARPLVVAMPALCLAACLLPDRPALSSLILTPHATDVIVVASHVGAAAVSIMLCPLSRLFGETLCHLVTWGHGMRARQDAARSGAQATCPLTTCGDGTIESGEHCDQAN